MRAGVRTQTLARYRSAPLGDRIHARVRDLTCPFLAVSAAVPRAGRVLEFGCGHGVASLLLALDSSSREVVGVDIDKDKIAVASNAAEGLPNVGFEHRADGSFPPGEWDAVVFIDVLYLLGHDRAEAVLESAARSLRPGGVVVVKEIDLVPRWKYRWAKVQELAATRLFGITEGDHVSFLPPDLIEAQLIANGLHVRRRPAHRRSPWPHLIITGSR